MQPKFAASILFAILWTGVQAQESHGAVVALSPATDALLAYQSRASAIDGSEGQRSLQRRQQTEGRAQTQRERELERELLRELERERRIGQARREHELEQLRRQVAAREGHSRGSEPQR